MIAVLGAGAFGTALAISLAREQPVTLWGRNVDALASARVNTRRLPGHAFPEGLNIEPDLAKACAADTILLAIPAQTLATFITQNQSLFGTRTLVACCKGIDLTTLNGPATTLTELAPDSTAAILTGPSFAADIAAGLPTALTLACTDAAKGEALQQSLTTGNIRLYLTTDTRGAELGGALKNVIAIACGAAIGAGLGESARAALMTRGFTEIQRLAAHMGAEPATLAGLSGFGDLTLTCTSQQSRNYRFGVALGAGKPPDDAETVEGAATARAATAIAQSAQLELPIATAVAGLIDKELDVQGALAALLARPLRKE